MLVCNSVFCFVEFSRTIYIFFIQDLIKIYILFFILHIMEVSSKVVIIGNYSLGGNTICVILSIVILTENTSAGRLRLLPDQSIKGDDVRSPCAGQEHEKETLIRNGGYSHSAYEVASLF